MVIVSPKEITPTVTVKLEGRTVKESWYIVSYAENVNAGENARVTVSSVDEKDCVGSANATFAIRKKAVAAAASAENKVYDGQTSANVKVVLEESQIINGDEVQIAEVSGAFADANPGKDKVVMVKAVLTGKDASNYEVEVQETKATIEAYDPEKVTEAGTAERKINIRTLPIISKKGPRTVSSGPFCTGNRRFYGYAAINNSSVYNFA